MQVIHKETSDLIGVLNCSFSPFRKLYQTNQTSDQQPMDQPTDRSEISVWGQLSIGQWVSWLVGLSVKGREVSLPCLYQSIFFLEFPLFDS